MSDLDTLIATFQTQLSDVMEAVLKTAMFEVTRLVEDVLLVEVRRGKREVESLRLQLHSTEGKTRFVDCVRMDSDQSSDTIKGRPPNLQDDMSRSCDVDSPSDAVECWISNHKESRVATPDHPPTTQSPERGSQTTEEVVLMPNVDMKEEEMQTLSCSSLHLRGWSSTLDGEVAFKSDNVSELVETQPTTTQRKSEEILKTHIKKDPQASSSCGFLEDRTEMHMATDPPNVSAYEHDSCWAGLPAAAAGILQNHKVNSEKDSNSVKTEGSVKQVEHVLPDSVRADVQFNSNQDQLSSSESPQIRPQIRLQLSKTLGVTIKEEVIIDSYGCKESEQAEEKLKNAGTSSFSCLVQQHRVNSEAQKPNHINPKASTQEVSKLHSNKGGGLRLQAAMQHLHRPLKKAPHTFPSSPTAALSTANCQVVNVNKLNRICATSKTVAAPLSVQRAHFGAKHTAGLNRTGASWVSIKSQHQSANCDNPNPDPHPNSQLYAGSRQLLRCGQCGKCFPHPSNLKSHLQTHTGERPFCCSLCGRSFTKLSNLKAHRRVHTGERPYCCLACGKRFTQKCNLKRHQRIHLDM